MWATENNGNSESDDLPRCCFFKRTSDEPLKGEGGVIQCNFS